MARQHKIASEDKQDDAERHQLDERCVAREAQSDTRGAQAEHDFDLGPRSVEQLVAQLPMDTVQLGVEIVHGGFALSRKRR